MNKSNPLVSVIVVTYKPNLDYISQALDSIKKQTYKNIEIIIINDKSSDEIERYFAKLRNDNSNIIYVCNEIKKGVAAARNQGILLSKGDYVAMLDDDDYWNDEEKLRKQVEYLERHVDYGFVGVDKIYIVNENGKIIDIVSMRKSNIEINNNILQSNQFAQSGIMIRKESLYMSGIYDTSCFTEDYDLWCRIGKFYKFCNIDSSIFYRVRKNSLRHSNYLKAKVESFKVFWRFKKCYPNFFKALILRIGEFFVSENLKNKIFKVIKKK